MMKAFAWISVGLAAGLVVGGVAYAVVVNPPDAGERYYACVTNTGVVRYSTLRLDAPPTSCPSTSDSIHSWNAKGEIGPTGPVGSTGERGATGPQGTTGERGPATPAAEIVRIELPGTPFTITQGATHDFGPADTSQCRSISAGFRFTGGYSYGPSEGGFSVFDEADPSTVIARRGLNLRRTTSGGSLYEDQNAVGMADRGALGTRMGIFLTAYQSYGDETVTSAWFDCVRFGPTNS